MLSSQSQILSIKTRQFKRRLLMIIIPTVILAIILAIFIVLSPIISLAIGIQTYQLDYFPTSNGQNIHIKAFTINSTDEKIIQFQTNTISEDAPNKNLIDTSDIKPLSNDMKVIYFHKNNQIVIIYNINTKQIKFSVPADTGYKLLFPNGLSNEDFYALSSITLYLPQYLIEQFERVTGNNIKFTTQLSYDGVYNFTTKKYKLVSEEYLRFSQKKIEENEKDLADYVPVINNTSDIKQVARELAKCYSRIAQNFLKVVENNHQSIEQLQKRMGVQSYSILNQSPIEQSDNMLSCISLQHQLLRCQAEVWRSGQMQVENIKQSRPLEIWSYVLYSV